MTTGVIWMGGTGFGDHLDGISLTFLEHLAPGRFHKILVRYPASYIYPITYAESVRRGREALLSAIRENPGSVVGGYSQGAEVVGDAVAEIDRGLHPGLEVAACALIADPSRPIGAGMPGRPAASGYGISGQRFVPITPTFWSAAEGDPITAPKPEVVAEYLADQIAEHHYGSTVRGPADELFIEGEVDLVEVAKALMQRFDITEKGDGQ